jgi:hypothetical protein
MVPHNRGGFMQEQRSAPKHSSRRMPVPSLSLPLDYESQMQPMSASDHKSPSLLSANSFSTSTSSGTYESAVSNEQPLVSQAEDGSIEMATLDGLVEHLITDFSCESICFRFYCLSYWTRSFASAVGKDPEYKDTFFTTYTAFTTADDVFQCLFHRFHVAEASPGQHRTLLRIK